MGLNQRMPPLGACFAIIQSITGTSFNSLNRWRKSVFPLQPFPNFVSAVLCVVVFAASFLSALTLAGPEKYLILIVINFFMIAKHDLLKRLRAFVHSI